MPGEDKKNTNDFWALVLSMSFSFLAFGLFSNIAGAIIPKIRDFYAIDASQAALLASAFFLAFGLSAIPWGLLIDKKGKKFALVSSSFVCLLAVIIFAAVPSYVVSMLAMFTCGIGVTGLQTSLNPLVAEISKPGAVSRNLSLFMLVNGLGCFAAPHLVTYVHSQGLNWTFNYWIFAVVAFLMIIFNWMVQYPQPQSGSNDKEAGSSFDLLFELIQQHPTVFVYVIAIFVYVGVEVGVANTIAFYLQDKHLLNEQVGLGTEIAKNSTISNYWGGLLVGRFLGAFLLEKIPEKFAIMLSMT